MTTRRRGCAGRFTRLLATAAPVPAAMLVTEVGLTDGQVEAALSRLAATGAISRDESGSVVAAGGLAVMPARHRLLWPSQDLLRFPRHPHLGRP